MEKKSNGIVGTKSYKQLINERHLEILEQLKIHPSKSNLKRSVTSYLKLIRFMRPKDDGLIFIDQIHENEDCH